MAKPKGSPKTGGREKGTPNKRTQELVDILEEKGFSPASEIIRLYRRAWKEYRRYDEIYDAIQDERTNHEIKVPLTYDAIPHLKLALDAAKELMNYVYPKRKAIEITGKNGGPLDAFLRMAPDERARRRAELAARLKAQKVKRDGSK